MLIKFKKNKILTCTPLYRKTTAIQYDWTRIAKLFVDGGILCNKMSCNLPILDLFSFVKQIDKFEVGIREIKQNSTKKYKVINQDYQIPSMYGIIDLTYHPYYEHLVVLRELRAIEKSIGILSNKQLYYEIECLSKYLRLNDNEDVPPSFRFRILKPTNRKRLRYVSFYQKGISEIWPNVICSYIETPYLISSYPSTRSILRKRLTLPDRYDVFKWFITYKKFFFKSFSGCRSLKNLIRSSNPEYLKNGIRYNRIDFLLKKVAYAYVFLACLVRYKLFLRLIKPSLLFRFPTLQSLIRHYVYDLGPSYQRVENLRYDFLRVYARSLTVSYFNKVYFAVLTRKFEDLKLDKHITKTKKEQNFATNLASYLKEFYTTTQLIFKDYKFHEENLTKFSFYNLGYYNMPFGLNILGLNFTRYSLYSRIPKSVRSGTYSSAKRRKFYLRDTSFANDFHVARLKTFEFLVTRNAVPVKNIPVSFNRLTSSLFSFMNIKSKHSEYLRPAYSSYSFAEKRLHNLLILQGVLFEYWNKDTQLAIPGQISSVMFENINMSNEIDKYFRHKSNYKTAGVPPIVQDFIDAVLDEADETNNRFKRFLTFFGNAYFNLKFRIAFSVLTFLDEMSYAFKLFRTFLFFLSQRLYSWFLNLPKRSSGYVRFISIVTIWNSTYIAEDALHDLEGDSEPWRELSLYEPEAQLEYDYSDYDGTDEEDEEVFDTEKMHLARDLNYLQSFFEGLYDFTDDVDDFIDDIQDVLVVDGVHYLSFLFLPIVDFFVRYPLWSLVDLYTDVYTGMLQHYSDQYLNFISRNSPVFSFLRFFQIILILLRCFVQFVAGLIFFLLGIYFLDYNDMQIMLVYTFDITFRDIYYIVYVLALFICSLYIFGPLTVREFLRDELGFDNVVFMFGSTLLATPELYDPLARPLKISRDFGAYHAPTHTQELVSGMVSKETGLGDWRRQVKGGYFSRDTTTAEHLAYDTREYRILNHDWVTTIRHPREDQPNRRGHMIVPGHINDNRRIDLHIANPSAWAQNKQTSFDILDYKKRRKFAVKKRRTRAFPYEKDHEVVRRGTRTDYSQSFPFNDD